MWCLFILEIGLHPSHPTARYDRTGMLWFLKGGPVVALPATEARFSGYWRFASPILDAIQDALELAGVEFIDGDRLG